MARRFQNIWLWNPRDRRGQQPTLPVMDFKAQPVGKIGDDDKDIPSFVRKGRIQAIINTVGTNELQTKMRE